MSSLVVMLLASFLQYLKIHCNSMNLSFSNFICPKRRPHGVPFCKTSHVRLTLHWLSFACSGQGCQHVPTRVKTPSKKSLQFCSERSRGFAVILAYGILTIELQFNSLGEAIPHTPSSPADRCTHPSRLATPLCPRHGSCRGAPARRGRPSMA